MGGARIESGNEQLSAIGLGTRLHVRSTGLSLATMKKCVPAVILATVTLLACSEELLAVDICGRYPDPDPCLPGGVWDPILNRSV